jgi:fatty-acid desaturase
MFPQIPFHRVNWLVSSFLIGTLFLSITAVPVYLWFFGIDRFQIVLFFAMLAACGFSITLGYHRLFSHLTFQAHWIVRFFTVVFGAAHLRIPFCFGPANIAAIISMWITMTILIVSAKVSFMPTWVG